MISLTEEMVLTKSKSKDLNSVKKLNCWASNLNDVSILKDMPNIEILTLSVNGISTLKDFQNCKLLSELYIRNNNITDLDEIYYLKDLKNLKILWLADNDCALNLNDSNYRQTVLRNLPQLQKLDNQIVDKDELEKSIELGRLIEEPNLINCKTNTFENEINKLLMPINEDSKMIISSLEECHLNFENNLDDTSQNNGLLTNRQSSNNEALDLNEEHLSETLAHENQISILTELNRNLNGRQIDKSNCVPEKQKMVNVFETLNDNSNQANSNVLSAILILVNNLNSEELEVIIQECQNRKNSLFSKEFV